MLKKTVLEKVKMLVYSIFTFSYKVIKSIFSSNSVNYLPNNNVLNWIKCKAFADNRSNIATFIISVFDRVENIVGKEENTGYLPTGYLLFQQCFKSILSQSR